MLAFLYVETIILPLKFLVGFNFQSVKEIINYDMVLSYLLL